MIVFKFKNGKIHTKPKVYTTIAYTIYMVQVRVHTTHWLCHRMIPKLINHALIKHQTQIHVIIQGIHS